MEWKTKGKTQIYNYLILLERCQKHTGRKDNLFNKWCGKSWILRHRRMALDLCLSPTSVNSKWLKLLINDGKLWNCQWKYTSRYVRTLWKRTPVAQGIRPRIDNCDDMKLKHRKWLIELSNLQSGSRIFAVLQGAFREDHSDAVCSLLKVIILASWGYTQVFGPQV